MKAKLLIIIIFLSSYALDAQNITVFDTVYTPAGYEDGPLGATVYLPEASNSNGVGVVVTHFYNGNRQIPAVWCDTLATNGYAAMSIDYYDWDTPIYGVYPKPIRAFKIAIEFLRRNANDFGITTGKIVGLGQSEGSVHWGQTIIWDNDDAYFQTDPTIDDHLDAVVLLYGLYDMNHYLQSVFPVDQLLRGFFSPDSTLRSTKGNCIANVENITTPILLFHGVIDPVVQYEQSVQLQDSLIAHGKRSESHIDNSWDHVFDIHWQSPPYTFTPEGLVAKDTVLSFLERTVLATSVQEPEISPLRYKLDQNYPNPFNPSTTINYSVPNREFVTLKVYNLLGKEIKTLVNEEKPAGDYEIEFDAGHLSSGIYFYRLSARSYSQVRKMILLK